MLDVALVEAGAVRGEAVDVWRVDDGVAVAGESAGAELVGDEEDEVWAPGGGHGVVAIPWKSLGSARYSGELI